MYYKSDKTYFKTKKDTCVKKLNKLIELKNQLQMIVQERFRQKYKPLKTIQCDCKEANFLRV